MQHQALPVLAGLQSALTSVKDPFNGQTFNVVTPRAQWGYLCGQSIANSANSATWQTPGLLGVRS